jgi:hypothetical protein
VQLEDDFDVVMERNGRHHCRHRSWRTTQWDRASSLNQRGFEMIKIAPVAELDSYFAAA